MLGLLFFPMVEGLGGEYVGRRKDEVEVIMQKNGI